MKNYITLIIMLTFRITIAQEAVENSVDQIETNNTIGIGTITGKILDLEMNNEPLLGATVVIKGTANGTQTDFDGNYLLELDAGIYILEFSYVGYKTVEKTVSIFGGKNILINIPLSTSSLGTVVIKTKRNRQKESALLLEQKKAVIIKQQIGAQELFKKGVSDIATAVTKTTGISKEEGSNNIFIRGLGDRYNSTTFNGLPLPSNDPSRKNIALNIFSTDIVELIDINKIYSNGIYGDFGGANINIVSKNHVGKNTMFFDIGTGVNSNAVNASNFYLQDGPNSVGFYNQEYPSNVLSGYNFTTSLDNTTRTPINQKIALNGGAKFNVGNGKQIRFFATASFNNEYSYREGIRRGGVNTSGIAATDYTFQSYNYETNSTAMVNLEFKANANNQFKFNSLFINSSNQSLNEYSGVINIFDNAAEGGGFLKRATFKRTKFWVNQLLGTHNLSDRTSVKWGLAYNIVNNITPDRRQVTLVPSDDLNPLTSSKIASDLANSDSHRFFDDLNENEYAINAHVDYDFAKNTDDDYKGIFTLGYSGRFKTVDFEATQFNFAVNRNITQPFVNVNDLDGYFNQQSVDLNYFSIRTFRGQIGDPSVLDPQTYNGIQNINGVYGTLQYQITPKFTTIIGLKAEHILQEVSWETSLDPTGDKNSFDSVEIMPNASLKYEVTNNQNIKFAASKSYTLPQFKERAPFQFEEDGVRVTFGNEKLYPSTNYNFDLRWEYFPNIGETISVTGFGKLINNPINQVVVASATNDISFVNTGNSAKISGIEFEIKKNIFKFKKTKNETELTSKLSGGINASYMFINTQDFDENKVRSENDVNVIFTNIDGKLTGASDLLLNADLSFFKEFSKKNNILATFSYNYFSDRVNAIGSAGKGDLIDEAIGTLDFIFKLKLSKRINVGLSIKNILNPKVKRYQDNASGKVNVLSFDKGSNASFSIKYALF